jgi:hypothetical protein
MLPQSFFQELFAVDQWFDLPPAILYNLKNVTIKE